MISSVRYMSDWGGLAVQKRGDMDVVVMLPIHEFRNQLPLVR